MPADKEEEATYAVIAEKDWLDEYKPGQGHLRNPHPYKPKPRKVTTVIGITNARTIAKAMKVPRNRAAVIYELCFKEVFGEDA